MQYKPCAIAARSPVRLAACILLAWFALCPVAVRCATINWAINTWTPGALSMTYYATNTASTGIYYNDPTYSGVGSVTISFSGDTNELNTNTLGNSSAYTGGTGSNSLEILTTGYSSSSSNIIVTVTFNHYSAGVTGLTSEIFDVDRSQLTSGSTTNFTWVDQLRYVHAGFEGTNNIAAIVTGSPSNVVAGSGTTNNAVTGINPSVNNGNGTGTNSASNGNVYFNFGTNTADLFAFTYGDASSNVVATGLGAEGIGLYNINFTANKPKVPEFQPSMAAASVCGLFIVGQFVSRRRRMQACVDPDGPCQNDKKWQI